MVSMLDLKNALFEGGVVGAGGAGFPTHAKLSDQADTVILNCAECEPLLRLHRQLLEKYAKEIIDTFHMIGETVGAKEVIIGIKKAYTATIEAVKAVMGQYPEVRLGLLDEVYPAGAAYLCQPIYVILAGEQAVAPAFAEQGSAAV